jgi:hypothetical protein
MLKVIITATVAFSSISGFSQKTFVLKDLFMEDTIIWYGIDYSKTTFVGTFTGKDLNEYFIGWNRLITEEPEKYNIPRVLKKKTVVHDLHSVTNVNGGSEAVINPGENVRLRSSDLQDMISSYESNFSHGLGFVLIPEQYNRPKDFATHFAVIFDVASKKILIAEKYSTSPDGIGVRNYWAGAILKALKALTSNYKKWEKKYG